MKFTGHAQRYRNKKGEESTQLPIIVAIIVLVILLVVLGFALRNTLHKVLP